MFPSSMLLHPGASINAVPLGFLVVGGFLGVVFCFAGGSTSSCISGIWSISTSSMCLISVCLGSCSSLCVWTSGITFTGGSLISLWTGCVSCLSQDGFLLELYFFRDLASKDPVDPSRSSTKYLLPSVSLNAVPECSMDSHLLIIHPYSDISLIETASPLSNTSKSGLFPWSLDWNGSLLAG